MTEGDINNWVIGLASASITYIGEEVKHTSVLRRSLSSLVGLKSLLIIAKDALQKAGRSVEGLDLQIQESGWLEKEGKELYEDNCSVVHLHSIVSMWVSVEVGVEDTVALALLNERDSFSKIRSGGLNIHKRYSWPLGEEACQRLSSSLLTQSRAGRSVGESYVFLLSLLDIPVELTFEDISMLAQLNAVRNCILHRQGIIDLQATTDCEGLRGLEGTKIRVSAEMYHSYFEVCFRFATGLLIGALKSPYVKTKTTR